MSSIGIVLLSAGALCAGPAIVVLMLSVAGGKLETHLRTHRSVVVCHLVVLVVVALFMSISVAADRNRSATPGSGASTATQPNAAQGRTAQDLDPEEATSSSGPGTSDNADNSSLAATQHTRETAPVPAGATRVADRLAASPALLLPDRMGLWPIRETIRSGAWLIARLVALGALFAAGALAVSFIRLRRFEHSARESALVSHVGETTVYRSVAVSTPFSAGVFRPRIYLSDAAPERLQDAILAHERSHVLHHDNVWNAVEQSLRVLLWFSPFVHLLERRGRLLREMRADAGAVGVMEPRGYVTALMTLSRAPRLPRLASALALPLAYGRPASARSRGTLMHRARRLLSAARPVQPVRAAVAITVATMTLVLASACVTPGVRRSYQGLPLVYYGTGTIDGEGRALHTELYDAETGTLASTTDYQYLVDSQGHAIVYSVENDIDTGVTYHAYRPSAQAIGAEDAYYTTVIERVAQEGEWPGIWKEFYDDNGRLIRAYFACVYNSPTTGQSLYSFSGRSLAYSYRTDGSYVVRARYVDIWHGGFIEETEYDVDGRRIHRVRSDSAGRVLDETVFSYDDEGREVVRLTRRTDGSLISARTTTYRTPHRAVGAVYRSPELPESIFASPFVGRGGPWVGVAGDQRGPVAVTVLERDSDLLDGDELDNAAASLLADLAGFRDQARQAYEPFVSYFPFDEPEVDTSSPVEESVRMAFRIEPDHVRFVGGWENIESREDEIREMIGTWMVNLLNINQFAGTFLDGLDDDQPTFLVEMTIDLRSDPQTGLRQVWFPDELYAIAGIDTPPVRRPEGFSAPITDRLPVSPVEMIDDEFDSMILSIVVLPDGTIVDPYVIRTAPEPREPGPDVPLTDWLWGWQLPPTGSADEQRLTLRLARTGGAANRRAPGGTAVAGEDGYAVLSTDDPALAPWLASLAVER